MTNEKLFKTGDMDTLYRQNICYFYSLAKKYHSLSFEDIMSCCNLAFTKTIKSYSPDKNTKFMTYLSHVATNEIFQYMRKQRRYDKEISMDSITTWDGDGNNLTIGDTLADEHDFAEELAEKSAHEHDISNLHAMILCLPEKQRQAIQLSLQGKLEREIAENLNLSQSYVSRMLKKSIKNLKKVFKGERLMNNKEKCFEYFTKNDDKAKDILTENASKMFGITPGSAEVYYYQWKKDYMSGKIQGGSHQGKRTSMKEMVQQIEEKEKEKAEEKAIEHKIMSEPIEPEKVSEFKKQLETLEPSEDKEQSKPVTEQEKEPVQRNPIPPLIPVKLQGEGRIYSFFKDGVSFVNTGDANNVSKIAIMQEAEALNIWEKFYGNKAV